MVPHNLQVTFMRPEKGDVPVRHYVERPRDSCSFATRRVTAVQDGATLCEAFVSFGHTFDGLASAPPMPAAPPPGEERAR
jgi:acyl-CoA thioesterase-2